MEDKPTKLTEAQERAVMMLRFMGRTEAQAREYVMKDESLQPKKPPQDRARKMTANNSDSRRSAFADLQFKPHRPGSKTTATVRQLTNHNAGRTHDKAHCPACVSRQRS